MQYCYKFCKQCLSSKFWLMFSWVLVLMTSMGVTDYIKKSGIFSESLRGKKKRLKDNIFTIRRLKLLCEFVCAVVRSTPETLKLKCLIQ